jgi:hypothetical protein
MKDRREKEKRQGEEERDMERRPVKSNEVIQL